MLYSMTAWQSVCVSVRKRESERVHFSAKSQQLSQVCSLRISSWNRVANRHRVTRDFWKSDVALFLCWRKNFFYKKLVYGPHYLTFWVNIIHWNIILNVCLRNSRRWHLFCEICLNRWNFFSSTTSWLLHEWRNIVEVWTLKKTKTFITQTELEITRFVTKYIKKIVLTIP